MPSNEYIYFNHHDLFTFSELDDFVDGNPLRKAEMLADKLIQKVLISKEQIYLYIDKTASYEVINTTNMSIIDYLMMIVRKYVVDSYELLLCHQKNLINKMYHNEVGLKCKLLFSLDYYADFVLDIYHLISYPDITFDATPNQTHYRNGYVDHRIHCFHGEVFIQRDLCVQYITKFINEDYVTKEDLFNPFISDDEGEEEEDEPLVKSQFSQGEFKRIVSLI